MRRITAISMVIAAASGSLAAAQNRGSSGMSSSGFGSSSSSSSRGFSGQVGSLGGFRSNTSTFGQPSNLLTGRSNSANMGSDAFSSTRQDALSIGRASGTGNARSGANSRNSSQFGGMSGFNSGGSGRNFGNMNQNMQQNTRRAPVATQIAFEVPRLDTKAVAIAAQSPLTAKTMPNGLAVNLQVRDGIGVLTGTVPSQRDAALAAAIISLEPGIRSIDNRLTVAGAAAVSPPN